MKNAIHQDGFPSVIKIVNFVRQARAKDQNGLMAVRQSQIDEYELLAKPFTI